MARRALWNTLVVVGKVEKLWQLGWHCFPKMMALFEMFAQAINTPEESELLESLYSVMQAETSQHTCSSASWSTLPCLNWAR